MCCFYPEIKTRRRPIFLLTHREAQTSKPRIYPSAPGSLHSRYASHPAPLELPRPSVTPTATRPGARPSRFNSRDDREQNCSAFEAPCVASSASFVGSPMSLRFFLCISLCVSPPPPPLLQKASPGIPRQRARLLLSPNLASSSLQGGSLKKTLSPNPPRNRLNPRFPDPSNAKITSEQVEALKTANQRLRHRGPDG